MEKLGCVPGQEVYLVLEEDGTEVDSEQDDDDHDDDTDEDDVEVDDEEYFQSLPDNTRLMLLHHQDLWSPVGPPYM